MITDQKEHCSESSSRNEVMFQNFYSQLNLEFVFDNWDLFIFLFELISQHVDLVSQHVEMVSQHVEILTQQVEILTQQVAILSQHVKILSQHVEVLT